MSEEYPKNLKDFLQRYHPKPICFTDLLVQLLKSKLLQT